MPERFVEGSGSTGDGEEGLRDKALLEITRTRMEVEAEQRRAASELERAEEELIASRRVGDQTAVQEVEEHIARLSKYQEEMTRILRELDEKERSLRQKG